MPKRVNRWARACPNTMSSPESLVWIFCKACLCCGISLRVTRLFMGNHRRGVCTQSGTAGFGSVCVAGEFV